MSKMQEVFREKGLNRLRELLTNKPELSVVEDTFVNFKSQCLFIHKEYGEWWAYPALVFGKREMKHPLSYKISSSVLRNRIHNGYKDVPPRLFIDFNDNDFVNISTKMKFVDCEYGEWYATPNSVLSGCCHKKRFLERIKVDQSIFSEKLKEYISIDIDTYVDMSTKCKFIDKEYGEWWAIPSRVLCGSEHPDRAINKIRVSSKEVNRRIKQGIVYSEPRPYLVLDESTYTDCSKKATFIDSDYGTFEAYVYTVLRGVDHPERVKLNSKLPIEEVKKRLLNGHNGYPPRPHLSLDESTYTGSTSISRFIDRDYGEWFIKPIELLNSYREHPSRKATISYLERIISEKIGIDKNNKKIGNSTPDFLIEEYKLIIECDGLYYHSEKMKLKNHHFNRRIKFLEAGYKTLQFREDEINFKTDIVCSIINNYLNKSNKIFARKCSIKEVKASDSKKFFDENHLMGGTNCKAYGLYVDNELQACMSYKVKNNEIHIERFCNKINTTVIGGYSRLLRAIENKIPDKNIVNFVDLRYGNGNHLLKYGFKLEKTTLGWKWTNGSRTYNRLSCRANMDDRKMSERGHAEELKLYKIYDAGQAKFIKIRAKQ